MATTKRTWARTKNYTHLSCHLRDRRSNQVSEYRETRRPWQLTAQTQLWADTSYEKRFLHSKCTKEEQSKRKKVSIMTQTKVQNNTETAITSLRVSHRFSLWLRNLSQEVSQFKSQVDKVWKIFQISLGSTQKTDLRLIQQSLSKLDKTVVYKYNLQTKRLPT